MPRKPKSTKVTLTSEQLKKDNAKYDKLTTVTFSDSKYTSIYKHFSNPRIQDMLEDYGTFVADHEKHGQLTEKMVMNYLYIFIVLHFSTLVEYDRTIAFENKITLLNEMMKHDYVSELEEHFDKNEIAKVYDTMFKKLDQLQQAMKNSKEMRDKLLEKVEGLENADLIKKVLLKESQDDVNV